MIVNNFDHDLMKIYPRVFGENAFVKMEVVWVFWPRLEIFVWYIQPTNTNVKHYNKCPWVGHSFPAYGCQYLSMASFTAAACNICQTNGETPCLPCFVEPPTHPTLHTWCHGHNWIVWLLEPQWAAHYEHWWCLAKPALIDFRSQFKTFVTQVFQDISSFCLFVCQGKCQGRRLVCSHIVYQL